MYFLNGKVTVYCFSWKVHMSLNKSCYFGRKYWKPQTLKVYTSDRIYSSYWRLASINLSFLLCMLPWFCVKELRDWKFMFCYVGSTSHMGPLQMGAQGSVHFALLIKKWAISYMYILIWHFKFYNYTKYFKEIKRFVTPWYIQQHFSLF